MKTLFFTLIIFVSAISLVYATECRCGDPGVTLTVVKGCEGWTDATECTGWASVAHENGKSENDLFPDKTQLTAFDCTIQINCPSDNTNDGGKTTTEEKKSSDTGFCSILLLE